MAGPLHARRARGLDELFVAQRERLAAHDARDVQPGDRADGHEDQKKISPEHHHQHDHERNERHGIENVHDAHHQRIHDAARISGRGSPQNADHHADDAGDDSDHQRNAASPHHAHQQVAAQIVGAENVAAVQAWAADRAASTAACSSCREKSTARRSRRERSAPSTMRAEHRRAIVPQPREGIAPQAAPGGAAPGEDLPRRHPIAMRAGAHR